MAAHVIVALHQTSINVPKDPKTTRTTAEQQGSTGREANLTANVSAHVLVEHLVPQVHCHRARAEKSGTEPGAVVTGSFDHASTPLIGVGYAGVPIDSVSILWENTRSRYT